MGYYYPILSLITSHEVYWKRIYHLIFSLTTTISYIHFQFSLKNINQAFLNWSYLSCMKPSHTKLSLEIRSVIYTRCPNFGYYIWCNPPETISKTCAEKKLFVFRRRIRRSWSTRSFSSPKKSSGWTSTILDAAKYWLHIWILTRWNGWRMLLNLLLLDSIFLICIHLPTRIIFHSNVYFQSYKMFSACCHFIKRKWCSVRIFNAWFISLLYSYSSL